MTKFVNSVWQLIISTSNVTLEVPSLHPCLCAKGTVFNWDWAIYFKSGFTWVKFKVNFGVIIFIFPWFREMLLKGFLDFLLLFLYLLLLPKPPPWVFQVRVTVYSPLWKEDGELPWKDLLLLPSTTNNVEQFFRVSFQFCTFLHWTLKLGTKLPVLTTD